MNSQDSSPAAGTALRPRAGVPSAAALELFYDLVFVAAVVLLSDSYSHSPTASDLGWLAIVFAMVWLIWMQTSLLFNVSHTDSHLTRFMVLAQMLLLVLAAVSASDGLYEHSEYVGPILGVILGVVSLMQWRAASAEPTLRSYAGPRIVGNSIAGVILLATPLYGDLAYLAFWGLAILFMLGPSLRPDPLGGPKRDKEHLVERFGAFTIIMLGESFVKTGLTASEGRMEGLDLTCLVGTFVIVFTIWWLYFSDVPRSGPPDAHNGHLAWLLTHLPLHLCIVGIAVGTAKAVAGEGNELAPETIPYLTVPLVGVLVCLAVIEFLSGDRHSSRIPVVHVVGAAIVATIGLIGTYADPAGIEATSAALAVVMVAVVIVVTRLRRRTQRSVGAAS